LSKIAVGAHGTIIKPDGKILITKRTAHDDYMPGCWDLPGGGVEFGEDVEAALIREFKEEVNLTIEDVKPVFVYTDLSKIEDWEVQMVQIVFVASKYSGSIELDLNEHDEYAWIDPVDLPKYECMPFLKAWGNHSHKK